MQSEDSLGHVPYNFEPEYSISELEMLENTDISHSEGPEDEEWCDCENCAMASRDENICCRSNKICCGTLERLSVYYGT